MIWKDWSGVVPCVLVVLVLLQSPGSAQAQDDEIRCNYSRKFVCAQSGCQEGPVGSAYLLLPRLSVLEEASTSVRTGARAQLPTLRRCDSDGCTAAQVTAIRSGVFTTILQPHGAYFLKIASEAVAVDIGPHVGDFVEVASLILGTVTYFGSCPAVAK
jgi:hypothetical protein